VPVSELTPEERARFEEEESKSRKRKNNVVSAADGAITTATQDTVTDTGAEVAGVSGASDGLPSVAVVKNFTGGKFLSKIHPLHDTHPKSCLSINGSEAKGTNHELEAISSGENTKPSTNASLKFGNNSSEVRETEDGNVDIQERSSQHSPSLHCHPEKTLVYAANQSEVTAKPERRENPNEMEGCEPEVDLSAKNQMDADTGSCFATEEMSEIDDVSKAGRFIEAETEEVMRHEDESNGRIFPLSPTHNSSDEIDSSSDDGEVESDVSSDEHFDSNQSEEDSSFIVTSYD